MALKGHIPWNKGIPRTEDVKRKIREARANQIFSLETREKMRKAQTGRKHSFETRKKMSKSMTGIKRSKETCERIKNSKIGNIASIETRKKMSDARMGNTYARGFKHSLETRLKVSIAGKGKLKSVSFCEKMKGSGNHQWKGGLTSIHRVIRHSREYRLWREAVFKRDKYTCIWCGDDRGGNLNADHIKPFATFPELRFSVENGRTLCVLCHRKTDTYGPKALKSSPQFDPYATAGEV